MNISKFFIDRPVFAGVLSILIFISGLISITLLPTSEYPEVVPPSVVVRAQLPGANPKVVAETVAAPLEEQINGVENMLYMQSQSNSDGNLSVVVTFKLGTDPDKAQQLVQNRVSQALPRLPEDVQRRGVTTTKSTPTQTLGINLLSPNGRYDLTYLRNYAVLNLKDELARLPGVGEVAIWGSGDYAMRVWLDPQKIARQNMTAMDVIEAIRDQNIQVTAGIVGSSPMSESSPLQLNVNAKGRLKTEDEFKNIILKTHPNGALTRLGDVARIELGTAEFGMKSMLDSKPAVQISIFQQPGANALQLSDDIRSTMDRLSKDFPEGIDYAVRYDPTQFVRASIHAVIHTLIEAIVLVVLVVILFLQTWRASIIPLLAVPVSVVGTFALLLAFGFTINTLTLFGLVLAIGIVVDDAIVVVENVERNIALGMSPRDATYLAMEEVSGPIIAIALTLVGVFVPLAFMPGLTGQFYQQFAMTIAISTVISAINSLTLSPALAALLLRNHDAPKDKLTRFIDSIFGPAFRKFNTLFDRGSIKYGKGVKSVLNRKLIVMSTFLVLIGATIFLGKTVPGGFVPDQDKDFLVAIVQLPSGASLSRTEQITKQVSDIALSEPGVAYVPSFAGLSVNGLMLSSNNALVFPVLKPSAERGAGLSAKEIAASLNAKYSKIKEANIAIFEAPPVSGLGTVGGFKLQIQDRGALGYEALDKATKDFIAKAAQTPELGPLFTSYQINVPQLDADLDRDKAKQLNIPIKNIFETMQIYLGSLYVNDFNQFGRVFQVQAQADAPFRANAENIGQLNVRSADGQMIPLSTLVNVSQTYGPESVVRYNGFLAADINGGAAPGYSSDQAMAAVERIAAETLPRGIEFEWTDLTYQQILAGNAALWVFPISILLVFLILAAQYESLTLPLAILMIVPMSILSALFGVWITGGDNNIFTQIGLVVLVGLSAKNAILIVEFARELEIAGRSIVQAAIEASRLRLRPILMTSIAFIMGVVPLVISTGAGSEMRSAMGIAVFFGMLGVTFFGLLLTPVFYVVLRKLSGKKLSSKNGIPPLGLAPTTQEQVNEN